METSKIQISVGLRLGTIDCLSTTMVSEDFTIADLVPQIERVQNSVQVMQMIDNQLFVDFKKKIVPKSIKVVLFVDGCEWSDKLSFSIKSTILEFPKIFKQDMTLLIDRYFSGSLQAIDEVQMVKQIRPRVIAREKTAEQLEAAKNAAKQRKEAADLALLERLQKREYELGSLN